MPKLGIHAALYSRANAGVALGVARVKSPTNQSHTDMASTMSWVKRAIQRGMKRE